MKMKQIATAAMLAAGLGAQAAVTYITDDITTSTHLPALPEGDYYSLTNVVYVMPGASLTLDAGVVFKNSGDGSLGVARGGQLFVDGTKDNPVIFTALNDDFATWQAQCNQWGSIAICGNGLISASHYKGSAVTGSDGELNSKEPDGRSDKEMEGLSAAFGGDTRHYYGGNNDNDDSGSIKYLSIRYGGQQSSEPNKELNGLSLGGVGAETDIDYVEIMNNVDDGIEIWGGKVNLKHVNIWNIGDDSFDIDEGWRGKAQFGLIVQGYSGDYNQGSGVGDNIFEHDGAEDSDAQPVTTAVIANFTAIGQGNGNGEDGDGATAWRDGARMQYRNCIFMDCSEEVVRPDGDDGDGANGYGYNGTLTLAEVFQTPYTTLPTNSLGIAPQTLYNTQAEGTLAGFKNCVFYNNNDYFEFEENGQTNAALNNIVEPASMPIAAIVRDTAGFTSTEGKTISPVISLDPCPANDAMDMGASVTADGFFETANYAGGFAPNYNWLLGWSAADQYGFIDGTSHAAPAASISKGGVSITFQSQDSVVYKLQSSSEASFTTPVDVAEFAGDGTLMTYVDAALDPVKFYRVVFK
ncbi:hypothetical protein [Tichowtungia aerotolerans]|uniref:Uncharacterized protein n=1 Tax=Tichowtungia aerotolerans TaxID=2697043 RepID=A0A6P1MEJ9_9BACT|nr:hypothetical protein [Tichowtungia aerotolerans]QHI70036.1 hypothetical protein GT409_11445 [Tichowtungia aerotolerans]